MRSRQLDATCLASLFTLMLVLSSGGPLTAQLVPYRMLPVHTGDQLDVLPSTAAAMGGVSLAVPDPLADPFRNPALAPAVGRTEIRVGPTLYDRSGRVDRVRTGTVGFHATLGRNGAVGGVAALQKVTFRTGVSPWYQERMEEGVYAGEARQPDHVDGRNARVAVYGGWRPGGGRLTVGASVDRWAVESLEGVRELLGGVFAARHRGAILDVRLGAAVEVGSAGRAEVVAVRHRRDLEVRTVHVDEHLAGVPWDELRSFTLTDDPRRWGLETRYVHRFRPSPWRVAGRAAYERIDDPPDPVGDDALAGADGNAWSLGFGLARSSGGLTLAGDIEVDRIELLDVHYNRYLDIERWLPAGAVLEHWRTDATDVHLRLGAELDLGRWGMRAGLAGSRHRNTVERDADHGDVRWGRHWTELRPSWGARLRVGGVEALYIGRATLGTGTYGLRGAPVAPEGGGFDAPELQEMPVVIHRLTLRMPLR